MSKRQSELREFPSGTECSSFSDESCGPRSGHGLRRTSWRTPLYRRCASLESNVFGTEVSLDSGIDIPACSHADGSEDVAPGKSRLETLPSEQICGEHAGATAPCEETRRDMSDGSAQVSDGYPEYELVDVTSDHSSVDLSSHAEPCRRTHWDTFGDWETDNTLYLSFRRDLLSSDAGPSSSNVANLEEAHDFRGIKVDMEESLIMGDMLFECNDLMRDVDEHVATAVSEYWLSDDPLEMPQEWERTHAPVSDDGTNHGECSDFGQIILAPDGDEPPRFKIVKKALGRGKNLVGMGHRAASRARRRLYARIAGLDGEHGY